VIGNFATRFAACIETGVAFCTLPVQRKQSKALAFVIGWYFAPSRYPVFEYLFTRQEQLGRGSIRILCGTR
jgi:hypothetical protein